MELIYHYLWANTPKAAILSLCDGRTLCVRSAGIHNRDAGPDFSHARVEIDGKLWVGNVEIHTAASDWHKHQHSSDAAYDNIILHAVGKDDTRICRTNGEEIPQVVLHCPEGFQQTYLQLTQNLDGIRCASHLSDLSELVRTDWLETLSMERLHFKANRIGETMLSVADDWQEAIYITLARALGFGLNAVPFELLARATPLRILRKHTDNAMQIEALLFGQAGMLNPSVNTLDTYYQHLCREYNFLSRKYGLTPMESKLWKYSRTRPQNFAHRRIAILASAVAEGFQLTDKLLAAKGDLEKLMPLFQWRASEYWSTHSNFGVSGESLPVQLSAASIQVLMINVVAPYYMAYAHLRGIPEWGEHAISLLMRLPAESNSVITAWRKAGIRAKDALHSQALLHLRQEYCQCDKCRHCRFGAAMLRDSLTSKPLPSTSCVTP